GRVRTGGGVVSPSTRAGRFGGGGGAGGGCGAASMASAWSMGTKSVTLPLGRAEGGGAAVGAGGAAGAGRSPLSRTSKTARHAAVGQRIFLPRRAGST